ncbi:MAG: hypothetical protein ACFB10_21600 [Salibacteraceae bacterium]
MKSLVQNTVFRLMALVAIFGLAQGCVVVDNTPGPPGLPGNAWFGVGYASFAPYSYWDEKPSNKTNPQLPAYNVPAHGTK